MLRIPTPRAISSLLIAVAFTLLLTLDLSVAQAPPNQTDYIRNIIQRVKNSADAQNASTSTTMQPGNVTTASTIRDNFSITTSTSTTTTTAPTLPKSNTATSDTGPAKLYEVYHGELPYDREYWQFLNYYKNHSVVSLIVSGIDDKALFSALNQLPALQKSGIQIGEVVVTGGRFITEVNVGDYSKDIVSRSELTPEEKQIRATYLTPKPTALSNLSKSIGLGIGEPIAVSPILKRLNVRYSPTWVVRYHGTDYVYEGLDSPLRLFSKDGIFLGANQ